MIYNQLIEWTGGDRHKAKCSIKGKEIIEFFMEKFKNYKAAEIVNYMHEEKAYKKLGMERSFRLAWQKRLETFNK